MRSPAGLASRWWQDPAARRSLSLLALFTALCYLPVLQNQFTNWDDNLYVSENPFIQRLSLENLAHVAVSPVAFNYHPLTIWSLQANYLLAGLTPWVYFATNLLLHLLNCVLVFHLLFTLGGGMREAALAGTLLFAVHPMRVESVAWISERKDVLCAFFMLLTLAAYVRYVRARTRRRMRYLEVVGLGVLALLSKPAAIATPLLLLAVDYLEGRSLRSRSVLVEKLPFVALSIAFGILTLRIQTDFVAVRPLHALSVSGKLLVASYGFVMYLVKFVAPWKLSAFYPYPDPAQPWPLAFLAAPGVLAMVVAATLWSLRGTRVVFGGMLFFVAALAPVPQVASVGLAVMADRYTYLAQIGLALIVSKGYAALLHRWNDRPGRITAVRAILVSGVIAMGALTWQRVGVWRTSETLWSDVIAKYPSLGSAYISRGTARLQRGDLVGARRDLDRAVVLAPDDYMGFFNRGLLEQRRNDPAGALADYARAIAANPARPEPYQNRAGILVDQAKYDLAIEDYSRVIALQPKDSHAYFNRAATHFRAKHYRPALDDYDRGLKLDPSRPEERFFQGLCEYRLGAYEAAVQSYSRAILESPAQGKYYLYRALSLAALSRRAEAEIDAQKARVLGESVDDSFLRSIQ